MFKSIMRLAVGAAVIIPMAATAQIPGQFNTLPPPPDAQNLLGYQASSAAPSCPKLCPADNSPCDPIYMKDADGRCDGISGSLAY
jgi:hypothetical protein